jgi:very-short-patch-repair endonuclease
VYLNPSDRREVDGIPVTDPVTTLVDLATCVSPQQLESAVNEVDRLDLIDPESLRRALESHRRRPGVRRLRELLDRHTFALTQSQLERYFLAVARRAGMDLPQTQVWLNGHRVDFFWPELGLVVETDGLRYHRTPAQQAADRRRDQDHVRAGLTPLRFTHHQVRNEPAHVKGLLETTARRLRRTG